MAEFSLDALKKDIESRKQESLLKETAMGKSGVPKTDKRTFLVNLLNTVNGQADTNNPAVQAIRAVSENTEAKFGIPERIRTNQRGGGDIVQPQQYVQQPQQQQTFDRGEEFFDRRLREQEELLRQRAGGQPVQSNAPLSQIVSEYRQAPYVGAPMNEQYNPNANMGGGLNAAMLNEHIRKTMTEVLAGSTFDKLVEDTFRNVITEMYTKEKIENVINEFIDGGKFKKVVVDSINEMLKKKAASKA
jgi:hypothetical protein